MRRLAFVWVAVLGVGVMLACQVAPVNAAESGSVVQSISPPRAGLNQAPDKTRASGPRLSAAAQRPESGANSPENEKAGFQFPIVLGKPDLRAVEAFKTFVADWMRKLARAEEFQRHEGLKVRRQGDQYVAEYLSYEHTPLWAGVAEAKSSATPCVGRLYYRETIFRSVGKTIKQALRGPFKPVKKETVEEIFRYTGGRWIY